MTPSVFQYESSLDQARHCKVRIVLRTWILIKQRQCTETGGCPGSEETCVESKCFQAGEGLQLMGFSVGGVQDGAGAQMSLFYPSLGAGEAGWQSPKSRIKVTRWKGWERMVWAERRGLQGPGRTGVCCISGEWWDMSSLVFRGRSVGLDWKEWSGRYDGRLLSAEYQPCVLGPTHPVTRHQDWKQLVMNADYFLCNRLNGSHIKYLLILTKWEELMFQLRWNLAENNICMFPPLDNSNINKMQNCFPSCTRLGFRDVTVDLTQEGLRYLGFLYFVISLSPCPGPWHSPYPSSRYFVCILVNSEEEELKENRVMRLYWKCSEKAFWKLPHFFFGLHLFVQKLVAWLHLAVENARRYGYWAAMAWLLM